MFSHKHRLSSIIVAAALSAMGAASARADTIYTYTGPDFTEFYGTDECTPECSISGTFTVSTALVGGLSGVNITTSLTSFSFTDGYATLTNNNITSDSFLIWTNASGQITEWGILLIGGSPLVEMQTNYVSDTLNDATWDPVVDGYLNNAQVVEYTTSGNSLWSESTPSATTPLPLSLPLFASGLGALGLVGWRRKRKNVAVAA